jgi:hypothetical protein
MGQHWFSYYRMLGLMICSSLAICVCSKLYARSVYPIALQVENASTFSNASTKLLPDSLKVRSQVYLRQYTGMFSDVRQGVFNLELQKQKLQYGVNMRSEKEGMYLTNNRVYGHSTVSVLMDKKHALFAGAAMGLASISIGDNTAEPGGTDMAVDVASWFGIRTQTYIVRVCAAQVLNSKIAPLGYEHEFTRYGRIYASKKFKKSPDYDLRLYSECSYYTNKPMTVNAGAGIRWNENVELGFGVAETTGVVGFCDVVLYKKRYNVSAIILYEIQNTFSSTGEQVPTFQVGMKLNR